EVAAAFAPDLRVLDRAGVAVRIAEMHSLIRRVIQLVWWDVVSHAIAAVVRKPQFFGFGMPRKSHRITNTHRESLQPRAVRVHPVDYCVSRVGLANIARRSDRYIEHAVRTESDEFPPMVFLMRKLVVDDYWFRRTL